MKRLIQTLSLALLILLPAGACHREIPVLTIEIEPKSATLFVGETCDVNVRCYPEEATNLDELLVYSANEDIIKYQDGRVTAMGGGKAAVTATCGNVVAQSIFTVYQYKFTKGRSSYGIDYATGYRYFCSEPTVQEVEIILMHNEPNGDVQKFDVWVQVGQLGKELDFTKPIEGWSYVGAYLNNNEDGYLVFSSDEGDPSIRLADWGDPGYVTLTRGIIKVDYLGFTKYSIHADFELSNGYRFNTDWEGSANLKDS